MPDCTECKERRTQNIPFIAYEAECARHERSVKRLVFIVVLCVLLIVVSNLAWLYVWQQYDYEVTDESIDLTTRGGGNANYIGNDGDINSYGNNPSTQNYPNP